MACGVSTGALLPLFLRAAAALTPVLAAAVAPLSHPALAVGGRRGLGGGLRGGHRGGGRLRVGCHFPLLPGDADSGGACFSPLAPHKAMKCRFGTNFIFQSHF